MLGYGGLGCRRKKNAIQSHDCFATENSALISFSSNGSSWPMMCIGFVLICFTHDIQLASALNGVL